MLQKYPDLNTIVCYGDAAAVESMEAAKAAGVDSENFGIAVWLMQQRCSPFLFCRIILG